MGSAHKTAVFLVFISIGILMKWKMPSPAEQAGIKKIVLNLALPATIFIALIGVEVRTSFLVLPAMALALNGLLFLGFGPVLPWLGIRSDSPQHRTARMMVSSFAPGLTCFPFLLEYRGEEALAQAAMADLGNKVFVLIGLYLVAMHWHQVTSAAGPRALGDKLRSFAKTFLCEPVNLLILVALVMMSAGYSMASLPTVIAEPLRRLSAMMTPLVLLFIGLAVQLKGGQLWLLSSILLTRAAMVAWLCAFLSMLGGAVSPASLVVSFAFGLSACSFWPFMHISSVDHEQRALPPAERSFDASFAINMLALSFPLSTALILAVLSLGESGVETASLLGWSLGLTLAAAATHLLTGRRGPVKTPVGCEATPQTRS